MDTLARVCVVGLSVFIMTYMIRHLDGPLDVFEKLREAVGIIRVPVLDGAGNLTGYVEEINTPDRFFTKLVKCFWCLSTWVAMPMTILYWILGLAVLRELLYIWLGAIAIACIIYSIVED